MARKHFAGSKFVGGEWDNGFGLKFDVADDGSVSVTFKFSENKEGPSGLVHGGALGAVIDEAITVASFVNDRGGMTVNLNIDYKAPVLIGTEVTVNGRIDQIDGRKTFLSADLLLADGTIAVTAKGLFITPRSHISD